jgi:Tfp pilus assembly protein PilO
MKLSKREKLIAIGVGAAVGLYVFDSVLLSPLFDRLNAAESAVLEGKAKLDANVALQANRLNSQKRWVKLAGDSLKTDASAAEAQLLNRVSDFASGAQLAVASLKPERSEKEKGFQRITIRASATGTMAQVSKFLYSLRTADFPVNVNDLRVVSRRDGSDDLALEIGVSTIFIPPAEPTPEVRR